MASTLLSSEGLTPQLTPNFFNTQDFQIQMKENFIIVFEKSSFLGEGFELIAESVSLPERQFAKISVPYANKNINLAGRNSFGDMRIVVRDVINADTEEKLTKWAESILNIKDGTRGIIGDKNGKGGYKIDIEIIPLTPNGDRGRPSIARGCFPVSINWGELSYENSGIRTLDMTIAVDDFARKEVFNDPNFHDYITKA